MPKKTPGEEFKDLDLLAKLAAPKKTEKVPKIEVLDGDDDYEEMAEEELQNWEMEQNLEEPDILSNSTYGFANKRSDIFQKILEEATELLEMYNIASRPNKVRAYV